MTRDDYEWQLKHLYEKWAADEYSDKEYREKLRQLEMYWEEQ